MARPHLLRSALLVLLRLHEDVWAFVFISDQLRYVVDFADIEVATRYIIVALGDEDIEATHARMSVRREIQVAVWSECGEHLVAGRVHARKLLPKPHPISDKFLIFATDMKKIVISSVMALAALMMLSGCESRQRNPYYAGYGHSDLEVADSVVEEKKASRVNNDDFSPVPPSYENEGDDEVVPGEYGDNHGLIDEEGYLNGYSDGYDE